MKQIIWGIIPDENEQPLICFGKQDDNTAFIEINGQSIAASAGLFISNGEAPGSLNQFLMEDGSRKGSYAYGKYSAALNQSNKAYQRNSFAIGGGNQAGLTEAEFNTKYPNGLDSTGQDYDHANSFAFVSGQECKVTGRASAVNGGYRNVITGDYSGIVGGGSNTVIGEYCAVLGGYANTISATASKSCIFNGWSNTVTATSSGTGGSSNTVHSDNSHAFGKGLKLEQTYGANRTVVGQYNNPMSYALFVVGNGNSDNSRANALEVFKNGVVSVTNAPTTDNGVVRKIDIENGSIIPVRKGTGNATVIFGSELHTVSGQNSVVGGKNNDINSNYTLAFGLGLQSNPQSGVYKSIVGRYNNESSAALFQVGCGDDTYTRRNALEVLADGTTKVFKKPTADYEVVRWQEYIDLLLAVRKLGGDI